MGRNVLIVALFVAMSLAPSSIGGSDQSRSVAANPAGTTVYVTGVSYMGGTQGTFDMGTLAYNASNGKQQWLAQFDGTGDEDDAAYSVAVAPDASMVFVAGEASGSHVNDFAVLDYAIVGYYAGNGTERWNSTYDGAGRQDSAFAVTTSHDSSTVYVTGMSRNGLGTGNLDFATLALNATSGDEVWSSANRYNFANKTDKGRAIVVSPDDQYLYVVGESVDAIQEWAILALYASNGTVAWSERYTAAAQDGFTIPYAVAVSPDGEHIAVAGGLRGPSGHFNDATLLLYSNEGNLVNESKYNFAGGNEWYIAVEFASNSTFYVSGAGQNTNNNAIFTNFDLIAARFDIDGTSLTRTWLKRFDGTSAREDRGMDVGVSSDESLVFATGFSQRCLPPCATSNQDWVTIGYYASNGTQKWVSYEDGNGTHPYDEDQAAALTVAGQRVFVTGTLVDLCGVNESPVLPTTKCKDYGTVAYNLLNGARLWKKSFNGTPGGNDIVLPPDQRYEAIV